MQHHLAKLSMTRLHTDGYTAALETLKHLHTYRQRFSSQYKSPSARARTQDWLDVLGINQQTLKRIRFVHVAGTKGKGTTCLYCESMLTAYQKTASKALKVGCLTSPHVTNIRERIRLDAEPISEQLFAFHFSNMWDKMKNHYTSNCKSGPSLPGYPGFLALFGIYVLVKENVDIAVVETGIGGENDSTNVIPSPAVTGITSIGLDHVNILGHSLNSIAWHKAGIFKQGSPAYTVEQDDAVLMVLRDRAREKRISGDLLVVPEHLVDRYTVTVEPNMAFQRRNASLSIALVDSCLRALYPSFIMTSELACAIEKTELPGRSQIIKTGKLLWYVSSAHNEMSVEVASKWYAEAVIQSENPRMPQVLIFGHASQRDSDRILDKLLTIHRQYGPKLDSVIFCPNTTGLEGTNSDFFDPRSSEKPASDIHKQLAIKWSGEIGELLTVEDSVKEAIDTVQDKYNHCGAHVLIIGSVYQAGAAVVLLKAKGELD